MAEKAPATPRETRYMGELVVFQDGAAANFVTGRRRDPGSCSMRWWWFLLEQDSFDSKYK